MNFRSQSISIATLVTGILLSPAGICGDIADAFGIEIFDVPWTSSLAEVREVHPDGRVKKQAGFVSYVIADGRTIFGILRRPKDHIIFAFDTLGRLSSVGVEYRFSLDGYGALLNELDTQFGPHESVPNEIQCGRRYHLPPPIELAIQSSPLRHLVIAANCPSRKASNRKILFNKR